MTYELAKQLKDAGFPQILNGIQYKIDCEAGKNYVYRPTLSELIEACQYENICILNDKGHDWQVYINNKSNVEDIYYGSTPEEAVARLWLAMGDEKEIQNVKDTIDELTKKM